MRELFVLRGTLSPRTRLLIEVGGLAFLLLVWGIVTELKVVPSAILPSPIKVVASFRELHFQDKLIANAAYSIGINFLGYLEAIAVSLPLGFLIGLFPFFRALNERWLSVSRYWPLTAVIGLFIVWFGIGTAMKAHFLAAGIIVYLLPTVVQRIDEVREVYVQTVTTLGATKWQTIRAVFLPDVVSRVSDDIRVLVAISWTYVIIAEMVNMSEGGIGALAYAAGRQSRPDKIFAILAVITVIGYVQDRVFILLDQTLFPFKRVKSGA